MAPIRSIKNQYIGINAHLHSHWQHEGGWNRFHGNHIADLMRSLSAKLLPMGYVAELEPSIQIRYLDAPDSQPESDVTIYDTHPVRPFETANAMPAHEGVLVLPALDALAEPEESEKELSAVAIYEIEQSTREDGTPVAWLELLSPANKGNSIDAETYRQKRAKIVRSGLVFVEIDYLHESGTTIHQVPNYRIRQGQPAPENAHPYRIVVIDPRPSYIEGQAYISEFDVDSPIPTVAIPLNADDLLNFDFGIPYNKTFEETLYGWRFVDYGELPFRFERYSPADQQRIAQRMVAVLKANQQGIDLETTSFEIEQMSIGNARRQIDKLKSGSRK